MAGSKRIGGIRFGVSMDTAGIQRGARKGTTQIKSFVGASVRMLGVYAGAAGVVAVIKGAANSYEQLNRSMNRSLSIMGNVSAVMRRQMTSAAIEVASKTNASAKQAADAFFFLASAGLDVEQSLAALPTVAKFAQAGNFDLALATDLLTDAQSALGLTVKDATENMRAMNKVSDVLVKANTLANATVQQFSESLTNKAGAALKIVNKDIEEGVAVLAAFADQGIKGAEAGTGLNIVMRDLQTKAIKFSDVWRRAGVSVFDASGDMRNMGDIIAGLETALVGLSDQAKKTFLLDLGFSDKSVIFVQTLLGTSQKIKDYEAALRSAEGTTADVAGKMLTPMENALNKLSAAWTKLSQSMELPISAASTGLRHLSAILDKMAVATNAIANLPASLGLVESDDSAKASAKANVDAFLERRDRTAAGREAARQKRLKATRGRFAITEPIVVRGADDNAKRIRDSTPAVKFGAPPALNVPSGPTGPEVSI